MFRILLTVILPFLLPFAVYFTYWWFVERRRAAGDRRSWPVRVPWLRLTLVGVVLMALCLLGMTLWHERQVADQPTQRLQLIDGAVRLAPVAVP